jgi:hypothetical protein
VHVDLGTRRGLCAVTDDDVHDLERLGRWTLRGVDFWLGVR